MNPIVWLLLGLGLFVMNKKADTTFNNALNPTPEDKVFSLYRKYSAPSPMSAAALYSIWQWETGRGTSNLWTSAHNPGGLKYHPEIAGIDHSYGSVANSDGAMAAFPDDETGIKAHFAWFTMPRYKAATEATSSADQVQAIFDAGYAADPGWISGVLALVAINEKLL